MAWRSGDRVTAQRLNGPSCILLNDSTFPVPHDDDTIVTAWTLAERNDSYAGNPMWSSGGEITIRRDGIYMVGAKVAFAQDPDGDERTVYVLKNSTAPGTASLAHDSNPPSIVSGGCTPVDCESSAVLVAGDVLRVNVYHNGGTSLNLRGDTFPGPMRFWAVWQSE
ncbi:hypothetical protein BAY59_24270 [Prauserella coralliicola]|nr:hypothetical protein BAY59_24270 [Prauserella coralliicola]